MVLETASTRARVITRRPFLRARSIPSVTTTTTLPPRWLVDVAVLTIIKEEYDSIAARLECRERLPGSQEDPNLFAWEIGLVRRQNGGRGSYRVALALCGDQTQTSGYQITADAIARVRPRYVVLLGIAGGFPIDELAKGDVVVASSIWKYEYGKVDIQFMPRQTFRYRADQGLLSNAQRMMSADLSAWSERLPKKPDGSRALPKAVHGVVGSGDKLIDNLDHPLVTIIRKTEPKMIAVEMEGGGAAQAIETAQARATGVGFIMVRGISDMPQHTSVRTIARSVAAPLFSGSLRRLPILKSLFPKPASNQSKERDQWKSYAAASSASFLEHWIANAWPSEPLLTPTETRTTVLQHSFSRTTNSILLQVKSVLPGMQAPLDRTELARIETALNQGVGVILTGEAGSGKTGIAAMLAKSGAASGKTVLMLDARKFSHVASTGDIRSVLDLEQSLELELRFLCAHVPCRFILDQLDSLAGEQSGIVMRDLAQSLRNIPGLDLVVVCRKREGYENHLLDPLTACGFEELASFPLSLERAVELLNGIGLPGPSPALSEMCRNLLNLELVATLRSEAPSIQFDDIADELSLWTRFRERLVTRENPRSPEDGERILAEAVRCSRQALLNPQRTFDLGLPPSIEQRRLISSNLIVEETSRIGRFRHEKFQDYLYAWDATERRLMPAAIAAEIPDYRLPAILPWVTAIYRHSWPDGLAAFLAEAFNAQP